MSKRLEHKNFSYALFLDNLPTHRTKNVKITSFLYLIVLI